MDMTKWTMVLFFWLLALIAIVGPASAESVDGDPSAAVGGAAVQVADRTGGTVQTSSPGYRAVALAAIKYGVPVKLALRIAKRESRGNCRARSRAGARGVMQVMPRTGRRHGYSRNQLYNCRLGAEAGVRELRRLIVAANGDLYLVLVGYNCGQGCWNRRVKPRETRGYTRAIMRDIPQRRIYLRGVQQRRA